MKRIVLPVIAIILCLLAAGAALADSSQGLGPTSGACGVNLTWTLSEDGVLTVSGAGDMYNYTYDTPAPWEARKNSITAVVVESGVTSIGDYAFYFCRGVTSVTLPDGLQTIGQSGFYTLALDGRVHRHLLL